MEFRFEWITEKEMRAYLRSKENLKECEPFELLRQKYIALYHEWINAYDILNRETESNAHRKEYAKGGKTIHRGFYSPSHRDLFVGGCNRGSLYKRLRKDSKFSYEYIFDKNDKLICAKTYTDEFGGIQKAVETEFLVYEGSRELSFRYTLPFGPVLKFISECQYEVGNLVRYETAFCGPYYDGKICTEVNVEILEYEDDLMKRVLTHSYDPYTRLPNKWKYTFSRDDEGYLSTYIVEEYDEFAKKFHRNSPFGPYNVLVRRK